METEEGADDLLHAFGISDQESEALPGFPVLCHMGDFVEGEDVGDVHEHPTINF